MQSYNVSVQLIYYNKHTYLIEIVLYVSSSHAGANLV